MIKAIILANELQDDHILWIKACENYKAQIEYRIVNLTQNDWLEQIQSSSCDVMLGKPGGFTSNFKQLYDERIYILSKVLNYKIYPSSEEIFIYENKRFLSFWLKANNIPHPVTSIFYNISEAQQYLKKTVFPVVAKTNIGASGSGVQILNSLNESLNYITDTFEGKGAWKRTGPNLKKGGLFYRGLRYIIHPSEIEKKLKVYKVVNESIQKGYVILQQYVPHNFEWRVVRIGNSFFAHKKLKIGEKASGSTLKNYDNPPLSIFDFVKEITDKYHFLSQAVDIFESDNGYLVNEMQCIFGQSDSFQMLVDGIPGRYVKQNDKWIFESGDFNKNESFNLRVEWILNSLY